VSLFDPFQVTASPILGASWSHWFTHTTVATTPLDEGSVRRTDLYLTTQTLTRDKHPCPPVGFEPTISASSRPQTYTLDAQLLSWLKPTFQHTTPQIRILFRSKCLSARSPEFRRITINEYLSQIELLEDILTLRVKLRNYKCNFEFKFD
jgi:hypothetical protein